MKTIIFIYAVAFLSCSLAAGTESRKNQDSTASNDLKLNLLERIEKLESYVRQQDERIKSFELTQEIQQDTIQQLRKQIEMGNGRKATYIASYTGAKRAITTVPPKHVAFSAYLDHRENHKQLDTIIRFNKFLLNDGNCYSNVTGVFSAPVTGTYLFTYTINTDVSHYQLVVKLVLDGVNESDGISDPFHNLQELQGGGTVIMHVNAGQSVWLAVYNTANTQVDGRPDNRFSTFSGVLLYQ